MARNIFFSFHYDEDNQRASQVRNIGSIHGNAPVRDNDWEKITRGGDVAIRRWIGEQLDGTSCTIVLIGEHTAGRKWINYEIEESWNRGNGLLGIYINRLRNLAGLQSNQGINAFQTFTYGPNRRPLTDIVRTYSPPYLDSKQAYAFIANGIGLWVEDAIRTRRNY